MRINRDEQEQPPKALLTASEVATLLRVHPKRIYALGLPTIRLSGKSVRYDPRDIAAWLASRRCA